MFSMPSRWPQTLPLQHWLSELHVARTARQHFFFFFFFFAATSPMPARLSSAPTRPPAATPTRRRDQPSNEDASISTPTMLALRGPVGGSQADPTACSGSYRLYRYMGSPLRLMWLGPSPCEKQLENGLQLAAADGVDSLEPPVGEEASPTRQFRGAFLLIPPCCDGTRAPGNRGSLSTCRSGGGSQRRRIVPPFADPPIAGRIVSSPYCRALLNSGLT